MTGIPCDHELLLLVNVFLTVSQYISAVKIVLFVSGEIYIILHIIKRLGILMAFSGVSASFASNNVLALVLHYLRITLV